MASDFPPPAWLDSQHDAMRKLLVEWAEINSYTHNLPGIETLAGRVEQEFASLGGQSSRLELAPFETIDSVGKVVRSPLARGLRFVKRPQAPVRVLLCIHLDTVYPENVEFKVRNSEWIDPQSALRIPHLVGPGVVDAKGGLAVMLFALRAFEQSPLASRLGWEVILNTDEEIGSPGSAQLLTDAAKRNHYGLVFEPSLPDGSIVGPRKGSGNFTFIVRGKSAHAGRDFHLGHSAIVALAELISKVDAIQARMSGVTINCGKIEGGGPLNVVPDLAIGRFNVRVTQRSEQQELEQAFAAVAGEMGKRDGITVELHGGFHSPPKPVDPRSAKLIELVQQYGREMGLELAIKPSGGTCDGNRLADAGLAVVDTLGPTGGGLHSETEYVVLPSLVERAKLTARLLMKLAEIQ